MPNTQALSKDVASLPSAQEGVEVEHLMATGLKMSPEFTTTRPPGMQGRLGESILSVRHAEFSLDSSRTLEFSKDPEGVECLEWIGLTKEVAAVVIDNYETRDPEHADYGDLLDYVYGHIEGVELHHSGKSAREQMSIMGITQDIQEAILDPEFAGVLETETLTYWVKDTLRINYLAKRLLDHRLARTAATAGAATFNGDSEEHILPKEWAWIREDRPPLPNHTRLWKSFAASEMESDIDPHGLIDVDKLFREPGGDFNNISPALYFTQEKETADLYRRYMAKRCKNTETWLICVDVPDSYLASLKKEELWYSPDWKHYVWHCKQGKLSLPQILRKYSETDLIVGHICRKNSNELRKFKVQNIDTALTDAATLHLPSGQMCTQHVFMNPEKTATDLPRLLQGKVHIENHAPWNAQRTAK